MERLRLRSTSLLDLQAELRQQELLDEVRPRHGPMLPPRRRRFFRLLLGPRPRR